MKINKRLHSTARIIHLYVSTALLLLMLFFAVTGITLNHPEWFAENTAARIDESPLPATINEEPFDSPSWQRAVNDYLDEHFDARLEDADYDAEELSLVSKGPGHYRAVTIEWQAGLVTSELQDYGAVAVLNDLHKGRNSGLVWRGLLDLSALFILLFSLTGFILLLPQKKRLSRAMTYLIATNALCLVAYINFVP